MPFIIHRKPTYRLYIEEGPGGARAHVAELPGCYAKGSDASKAAGAAPRAITSFLAWLRVHREPLVPEAHISRPTMADLYIAEVSREGGPAQAGDRARLFDFDLIPWSDEKLERTLRWLGYSRADLLAKIEGLDSADLKTRLVAPDRSLWRTLWHAAHTEYGYISSVAGPLNGEARVTHDEPSDVRERLEVIRELFVREARTYPPAKRGEVVYAEWSNRPEEAWTLQKAVRRALEHELEHLSEIK